MYRLVVKGRSERRHAMITCIDTLFFQNREAQSEMPQEAAAQTGCTNRPPILMSLSQNEAGSKRCSEPGETAEKIRRNRPFLDTFGSAFPLLWEAGGRGR